MFMDPSAFEAEDIEKELRDAGLEPDATSAARGGTASPGFQGNREGRDDPLRLQEKGAIGAPPSSGSYFGLNSRGGPEGGRKMRKSQLRSMGGCTLSKLADCWPLVTRSFQDRFSHACLRKPPQWLKRVFLYFHHVLHGLLAMPEEDTVCLAAVFSWFGGKG